ncbi:MAG: SCO family protein [Desulfovibrionaceae bacterium]|nr:SCO family protein [Desulfovibrionaceae bacterium]
MSADHAEHADHTAAPGASDHESMIADGHTDHAAMAGNMSGNMTGHDHKAMLEKASQEVAAALAKGQAVPRLDVEEKLGQDIADGVFTDSEGRTVHLRDLLDAPVILLPVYYTCPSVCNLVQHSFSKILPQVRLVPGKEIKVVCLSFDETDTPELAARTKANYVKALNGGFPAEDWIYLTGSKEEIARVMDSIGFGYARVENGFVHPAVIVALAPGGKIVRYLYGTDFLPFDITMAATEAAQGKVGLSVKRVLSFCFNYDPQGRRYVFDFMRVAGFGILGFLVVFLAFLLLTGRKKRR